MTDLILIPPPKKILIREGCFLPPAGFIDALDMYTMGSDLPEGVEAFSCIPESGEFDTTSESYVMDLNRQGIKISASGRPGIYYAIQTLRQIIRQTENQKESHGDGLVGGLTATVKVPCVTIEDEPDFKVRGVLLDISRDRVPKMETLFSLVSLWSELKFNQLQLYMEHTFAYSKHERVWKDASPLTSKEIRILNSFCRERGIELVPNQNSFGHMERWLSHKTYHHLAESPEGFTDSWGIFRKDSTTLSPVVAETLPFLGELYDELLPNFDSEYINIGGDEPWELGMGRSKGSCEKDGLDRVYLGYIKKLRDLAGARGKKIQLYADIVMEHPHLLKELPEDILLVNWGYEAKHPFWRECDTLGRTGRPYYVCTGTSTWNSLGGRWSNTRENIMNGAVNGLKNGALGFYISEWGDNGHWQQFSTGLPAWYLGAGAAWNTYGCVDFDPQKAITTHSLRGDGKCAEALMLLQDVWEKSAVPLHNISLPAVLLLDPVYPYYRKDYRIFRDYDFKEELSLLDDADRLLRESGVDSTSHGRTGSHVEKGSLKGLKGEVETIRRETAFASKMLRLGCEMGREMLATPKLEIRQIPSDIRRGMVAEILELMSEYERLWKKSSRPGGLRESVGRMEALKSELLQ
ncbi:MAG: family 20 glycosylhydrolase [Spirochaetales bacterium]|nr:family 20 glycosylhydrolase [Spirochaetales bacterium]